jgi:hypothetical protein
METRIGHKEPPRFLKQAQYPHPRRLKRQARAAVEAAARLQARSGQASRRCLRHDCSIAEAELISLSVKSYAECKQFSRA